MVSIVLMVLSDGKVIKAKAENIKELSSQLNFTSTCWVFEDGHKEIKDKEETIEYINELN